MRRVFWVALGATAGILVFRKVTRTAEALTPVGIAESLAEGLAILGDAVRDFGEDVRAGMAEREAVLVEALGIDEQRGRPAAAAPSAAAPASVPGAAPAPSAVPLEPAHAAAAVEGGSTAVRPSTGDR